MALETNWEARQKPVTTYSTRIKPSTVYESRTKPYKYISRLRDETNIVCNEDWNVVYIFANSGIAIPTIWTTRQNNF